MVAGVVSALTLATAGVGQQESPRLWGSLRPGAYEVGFRTVDVPPLLRPDDQPDDRPFAHGVRLYLWYPATEGAAGERCSLGDFYRVQEQAAPSDDEVLSWLRDDAAAPVERLADDALRAAMDEPLRARVDAPIADGTFPLALWSMRHGVPSAHCVLNEFLASHGHIVAFAWPLGPTPPMPWEDHPSADKKRTFESMMQVLGGALDFALADPAVDPERITVLAWSYGGESATALQSRRSNIDLVISISGNSLSGWVFDPEDMEHLVAADIHAEYLYLGQRQGFREGPESSWPPLVEHWPHRRQFIHFNTIHHGNFNVHSGMLPGVLDYEPDTRWSVGGADARLAYESVCRLALAAIQDRFDDDASSRVRAIIRDLPDGFVSTAMDED